MNSTWLFVGFFIIKDIMNLFELFLLEMGLSMGTFAVAVSIGQKGTTKLIKKV